MADAAASGLGVGTVLADTYKITGLLGRGGMGAVWAAEHARLPGKRVAIKVLHAEVAGDAESLARFRREAEIASRLGHPNIVDVHDFNALPDGSPYLVLEYLEGQSLDARIQAGPMSLSQVTQIVRQIASALAAAHAENIVHRDLKPANIFLCPTERDGHLSEQAKVLDFGISKIRGSQTVKTQDSTILGTPQYMAPEQATGNHAVVDARTDIFALGAIVYEMLAQRPAFAGQTIPEVVFKVVYESPPDLGELVPSLPANVVAAVHKALAKKQEERFSSVSEFVEALTGSPLTTLRRGDSLVVPAPENRGEGTDVTVLATGDRADALTSGDQAYAQTQLPRGEPQTSSGSKKLLAALGALVLVGAAVGVTVVLMGKGGQKSGQANAAVAIDAGMGTTAAAPDAGPAAKTAAPGSVQSDAGSGKTHTTDKDKTDSDKGDKDKGDKDKGDKDKGKSGHKKAHRHHRPRSGKHDKPAGLSAEQRTKIDALLKEGNAALAGGNVARAIHMARRSFQVKPTAKGYYLLVRCYCNRSDLGNARANLHRTGGYKRAAKRYCAKFGIELD